MNCAQHSFVRLLVLPSQEAPDAETVIRWCNVCGCVVGDIDIDGRTAPGGFFKMLFPKGQK